MNKIIELLLGKSKMTSSVGIAAAVIILLNAAKLLLDNDPSTNPDWNVVIPQLLIALGLRGAADSKKVTG